MGPLTNRVKAQIYSYGLTNEINNFAFEVEVTIGMEITFPNDKGAK